MLPTETAKVAADEEPQVLFAVTFKLPPVVPGMIFIESVVELPVQPVGKVHV